MKNAAKIAILSLVLASCEKYKDFPPEPFVRLESTEVVAPNVDPELPNEHILLKFYFTDGDGDIGLEPNQTNPPHCATCDHYYNLYVNVNCKVNGVFQKVYDYNARIRNLTPNAENKSLEGNMIYKIDVANRISDTVRIDFYLEDRALHKSNTEITDEIYVFF
jgi:hypothetical protein